MRGRFRAWSIPYTDSNPEIIVGRNNLENNPFFSEFLTRDNLYMEIGCGKGGFMLSMAKKFPELNFLCIEKDMTCAAQCAKMFQEEKLNNVFVVSSDVVELFKYIKEHSIKTIFINHPDPWPKKKHCKRRLFYRDFLNQYKNLLVENGEVILKTDNDDLFQFSIEELEQCNWNIYYLNFDYMDDDPFDAITNYEERWREKNVKIKRLKAKFNEK